MSKIANIIIIVIMGLCLIAAFTVFSINMVNDYNDELYERSADTAYVVLQISDIHLDNTAAYARRAFRTLNDLVRMTNPDIIVFTGDLTNEDDTMKAMHTFAEFMEGLKIPWTYTFGNHDPEGKATKVELSTYLAGLDYCFYERGEESVFGEGNHYKNLDVNGKTAMTMFFFDSSGEEGSAHEIEQSQIDWYEKSVKEIALATNGDQSKVVPSIAFTHIPPRECAGAYREAVASEKVLYGGRGEEECPAKNEDLFVEKLIELGSTKALYFGHEHINNYVVDYKGVRFTYTNTFDHKLYIPTRGGTIINVKNDGTFTQQGIYRKRDEATYRISKAF